MESQAECKGCLPRNSASQTLAGDLESHLGVFGGYISSHLQPTLLHLIFKVVEWKGNRLRRFIQAFGVLMYKSFDLRMSRS
jgi:hypothetical protein